MRPRLAVAYDRDSSSPLEIQRGLRDGYELIWIVDSSQPLGPMDKVLGRLGAVVDVAGLDRADAIAAVSKCSPDGIVTFSDRSLELASHIGAELGLRYNSPDVTRLFLDKCAQRGALAVAGLVTPEFVAIPAGASPGQIRALADGLPFPAVLKPRRGYGSRETYHVERTEQLVELLARRVGDRIAASEDYVLEEYLPDAGSVDANVFGSYVSVESVVVSGEIRHLAVTGKFALEPPYRETGNFMPSLLSCDEEDAVRALASQAAAALGVEHGCLHTEIKLTPDGPRVIESNARVGGGGIEDIFVLSYDASLLNIAAMVAVELALPETIERVAEDVAYQYFVQPPLSAHRLVRVDGLDDVADLPGVQQLAMKLRVGDKTDWRQGSLGYVLSVRGTVPDRDALRSVPAQITRKLALEYS